MRAIELPNAVVSSSPEQRSLADTTASGWMLPAFATAAVLTVLFSLAERGAVATPGLWSRLVASNAIDWGLWALFVPIIVRVARVFPFGDAGHRARNLVVWIALGVASAAIHSTLTGMALYRLNLLPPSLRSGQPDLFSVVRAWMAASLAFNLIIFITIAGTLHAAMYYAAARARELRAADLEARLARSELTVLRMQLHPHFFFNALNTVSSLVVTDARAAQQVIAALGDLVRASIDHTASHEITLREELSFVTRYVEIQRARFRKRLVVELDIAPATLDARVPSLVLQPLVENAIRHGVEPYPSGGRIWIRARRDADAIVLSVDNEPLDAGTIPVPNATDRPGIGLANIRARLAQLYGDAQSYRAAQLPGGRFEVSLRFPFATGAVTTPAVDRP